MVECGWGEVCTNERGALRIGDNTKAHHVWAMEACGLVIPDLGPLPCDQPHPPLNAAGHGGDLLISRNVITQAFLTVQHILDLRLRQEHEVVVPHLDRPDGLRDTKATAVPYAVHPKVHYGGEIRLASQRWRCSVEPVSDMKEGSRELYQYYGETRCIYSQASKMPQNYVPYLRP